MTHLPERLKVTRSQLRQVAEILGLPMQTTELHLGTDGGHALVARTDDTKGPSADGEYLVCDTVFVDVEAEPPPSFEELHTLATDTACRSCGAPVVWRLTPSGKRMPVDPVPTGDGTVVIDGAKAIALSADALADLDAWEPRYTSHFATCPQADAWRKDGAK